MQQQRNGDNSLGAHQLSYLISSGAFGYVHGQQMVERCPGTLGGIRNRTHDACLAPRNNAPDSQCEYTCALHRVSISIGSLPIGSPLPQRVLSQKGTLNASWARCVARFALAIIVMLNHRVLVYMKDRLSVDNNGSFSDPMPMCNVFLIVASTSSLAMDLGSPQSSSMSKKSCVCNASE